jgi:hypothetical protein
LLPEIARDLHVTIPLAGFLVTAHALGVAAPAKGNAATREVCGDPSTPTIG